MNKSLYTLARYYNVPAQIAYTLAAEQDRANAYAFGARPSDGDTYTEGAVEYVLSIQPDDLGIDDLEPGIVRYSRQSELPHDALIITECDSRHYGFYLPAKTWAEFWPTATDSRAREYLFDRYAAHMRELIEYGYSYITVTAWALDRQGERDRQLHSESVGGFDDVAYGAQDVFESCKAAVRALHQSARRERRESIYWRNRDVATVA